MPLFMSMCICHLWTSPPIACGQIYPSNLKAKDSFLSLQVPSGAVLARKSSAQLPMYRDQRSLLEFHDSKIRDVWEQLFRDYVKRETAAEEGKTPSPDAFYFPRGKRRDSSEAGEDRRHGMDW